MVLAVPPRHWPRLRGIFAAEGVEATPIGRFSGDGQLRVLYRGAVVADLDCAFLHGGMPVRELESEWEALPLTCAARQGEGLLPALFCALADPNVASKESIVRR